MSRVLTPVLRLKLTGAADKRYSLGFSEDHMPRNPEDERSSAVLLCTELLGIRRNILTSAEYTGAHDRHLRELVGITLWKHSEAWGKIDGCHFWSRGALAIRQNGIRTNGLQHEHVFPKKQLIEILFALEMPNLQEVQRLFDELNIAAVVTRDEHRSLGAIPGYRDDIWRRYREANIEYVNVRHLQQ